MLDARVDVSRLSVFCPECTNTSRECRVPWVRLKQTLKYELICGIVFKRLISSDWCLVCSLDFLETFTSEEVIKVIFFQRLLHLDFISSSVFREADLDSDSDIISVLQVISWERTCCSNSCAFKCGVLWKDKHVHYGSGKTTQGGVDQVTTVSTPTLTVPRPLKCTCNQSLITTVLKGQWLNTTVLNKQSLITQPSITTHWSPWFTMTDHWSLLSSKNNDLLL